MEFTSKNGNRMLALTVAKTKEPDQYGKTHTAYVTKFAPKADKKSEPVTSQKPAQKSPKTTKKVKK